MKICHFGHINKNHSPIKYTYLFPRQDSREMKIQRPKLKHCSHVYSDNKVFQSLMFQPKANPDWYIPDNHEKVQSRKSKKSARKVGL